MVQNSTDRPEFPSWPIWDEEELEAVKNVLKSGQWWCGAPKDIAGKQVWNFNKEFAQIQGVKHAFACTNGTHAIEIALRALGIGFKDEVIVSDWTFMASAAAVVAVGAIPILCDIKPDTFLIDPDQIEKLLTPHTKAIVCVHLGGMPCEMDRILQIAQKNNLKVIEDCAHAHGSRYKGKAVGSWGDAGTFSFQASKILTAGEGGAIVCSDDDLALKIYEVLDSGRHPGKWFYDHFTYGSDFRLGEFNAAILRTQLQKFPEQNAKRNKNAQYLSRKLETIPGIHPQKREKDVNSCGYYVYIVYFNPDYFGGINYKTMYKELKSAQIPVDDCYPPLHRLKMFKDIQLLPNMDYSSGNFGGEKSEMAHFPVVEHIYSHAFELEHTVLLAEQSALDYVVNTIEKIQQKYFNLN